MKVRVPASAPPFDPVQGASRNAMPFSASSAAMARLADGETVLQSTMVDPLAAVSARPSLPRITFRDISVLPTQRKIKSLCRATSAGVAHATPPLGASISAFALLNDHRAT